jgi:MATE family multidrug resistance protein
MFLWLPCALTKHPYYKPTPLLFNKMKSQYLEHYRKTIHLAYPIVFGQISHILIALADNTMIGNYNATALAASAFANAVFSVILMLGIGFSLGLTPPIASAHAADDAATCTKLIRHGLQLSLITGGLLLIASLLLSQVLHWFGQPYEVSQMAQPYMLIIGFSILPVMIFQAFRQAMEGLSYTKPPMYVNFAGAALNILLNYLLIFGNGGFPEMGLIGAGIATLLARVLMAVFIVLIFLKGRTFEMYRRYWTWSGTETRIFRKLLSMGIPISMQVTFEVSAFSFVTVMVGWLGANELAAHQISLNIATITFLAATGISSAAAIRTANQMGTHNGRQLRLAGFAAYHLVIAFMLCCGLTMAATRFWLPTFYVQELEIQQLAASLLIFAAIFQISDGAQVVGMGNLRGMHDVKVPTLIALVAYWVMGIPLAWFFGFVKEMGVKGVWLGLVVALTIAALLLAYRFHKKSTAIGLQT